MGMLRCAVIVVVFAVITEVSTTPLYDREVSTSSWWFAQFTNYSTSTAATSSTSRITLPYNPSTTPTSTSRTTPPYNPRTTPQPYNPGTTPSYNTRTTPPPYNPGTTPPPYNPGTTPPPYNPGTTPPPYNPGTTPPPYNPGTTPPPYNPGTTPPFISRATTAIPQSSLPPTTQSPVAQDSPQDFNRPHPCGHYPSPGECQAAFPRYYYNNNTSQCDCYLFGGCDEDEGSYPTLEVCHEKCQPFKKDEGPTCKLVFIDNFSLFSPPTTTSTPITETTQPSLITSEQPNPASTSNEKPSPDVPVTDGNLVNNRTSETSQAPTNTGPVTTSPLNRDPSSSSPDRTGNPVTNSPLETNQPGAGHDSSSQQHYDEDDSPTHTECNHYGLLSPHNHYDDDSRSQTDYDFSSSQDNDY